MRDRKEARGKREIGKESEMQPLSLSNSLPFFGFWKIKIIALLRWEGMGNFQNSFSLSSPTPVAFNRVVNNICFYIQNLLTDSKVSLPTPDQYVSPHKINALYQSFLFQELYIFLYFNWENDRFKNSFALSTLTAESHLTEFRLKAKPAFSILNLLTNSKILLPLLSFPTTSLTTTPTPVRYKYFLFQKKKDPIFLNFVTVLKT